MRPGHAVHHHRQEHLGAADRTARSVRGVRDGRAHLALAPEHRRGHRALYGGLNQGRIDVARLRRALVGVPLPRAAVGRLVLAVDVSLWLRPDANTCADRVFCHTFGRGEGKHQMVPGWPNSVVAALETGRTSWTAVLDAARLEPGVDVAAVTTMQIREVVERLVAAGEDQEQRDHHSEHGDDGHTSEAKETEPKGCCRSGSALVSRHDLVRHARRSVQFHGDWRRSLISRARHCTIFAAVLQQPLDVFCAFLREIGRRLGKPVLMDPEGDYGHPVLGFDVGADRVVLLAEPLVM
ncbi:hypothetical protein RKD23_007843 [Streptomyces sp. SAI-170]